jgi:hypothetical protein
MVEVVDNLANVIIGLYRGLKSGLSGGLSSAVDVFLLGILISIVAIFIWQFYQSLSQRNIINLNLSRYNTSEHPTISKLFAIFLFFIEYLIVMPILIFLWFTALSIIIMLIAPERAIGGVLLITGSLVAAVRILAYHNSDIAKDVAKLFPFITLSVFLLSPNAFDIEGIIGQLKEIPILVGNVFYFLVVIIFIEVVLRVLHTIMDFWQGPEEK